MKKIFYKLSVVLPLVAAMALPGCKGELDVANLNNPSLETVVKDPNSVVNVPMGGMLNIFNAMDGIGLSTLDITGDYMSSSWGNFGMRDLGREPRIVFNNTIAYSNSEGTNLTLWRDLNAALGSAREPLVLINVQGQSLDKDGTKKITTQVKATCEYIQGVALGYLSMFFDKAFIFDEKTPFNSGISLSSAAQVRDAALAKLDLCIQTCNNAAEPFEVSIFNGKKYTSAQLVQIANSMAARILAYHPRTPAESASVDWARVKTYATNGIKDFDLIVVANNNNYNVTNKARWLMNGGPSSQEGTWCRIDQRIVSLISTNGLTRAATTPMRFSDPSPNLMDSLDRRTVTDKRVFTDWKYSDPPFRPERGYYFFSYYYHSRYANTVDNNSGDCHLMLGAENDLLLAEAIVRTGGTGATAAALINKTRQGTGRLPALTGNESNLLAHILYERSIELMNSMAGMGFLDARRIGYIDTSTTAFTIVPNFYTAGTLPHYPVPGLELTNLKLPIYTFGGQ